jgi:hypothetical protein
MAEERDPQVSRRYRELGSEEPPPSLDQAILAASRRSTAPRRRWTVPLAVAAAAMLAVGIALHVEREQPDTAVPAAPAERPSEVRPPASEARKLDAESQPQAERRSTKERNEAQEAPAAPAPIPQTAPAARAMSDAADPERLLEQIAELRKQGRHEEADKALEDFRRRYPDYRIPESALKK